MRNRDAAGRLDRRGFLTLALGSAVALAGCREAVGAPRPRAEPLPPGGIRLGPPAPAPTSVPSGTATAAADTAQAIWPSRAPAPLPAVPEPTPGAPQLFFHLPADAGQTFALTIDDGYDGPTVAAYARFAADTGIPITFNPNGRYAAEWEPAAPVLAPLIEAGQVQIGNHTFNHVDLRRRSSGQIQAELERNDEWVQRVFGITSRPWYRPPYGSRSARTDAAAAAIGFTHVAMWNGSLGDSRLLTPDVLLAQADRYLQARSIVLGHANHPPVTHLYGALVELIRSRELTPVTLDTAFGTSRATG